MKARKLLILSLGISLSVSANNGGDEQTTGEENNQALPNILYVVPWKDSKGTKKGTKTKLVLHDLIGDLYEPQLATDWD